MPDEQDDKPKHYTKAQLKRTPKIAEGDETPAGYLGYDGPREPGQHDEASTSTLNEGKQQPLDPEKAGPDAQAQEREEKAND